MERYDIAILGTGPAGLSAAITAKLRGKNVLLLGSKELSKKLGRAHMIQNYLGLPEASGEQLAQAFHKHLDTMGIAITEGRTTLVFSMGDYFSLQMADGSFQEASTVILATGVSAAKPYPGEEEFLGRGVSYCATCDAPLYRGKTALVIGSSPAEEAEADYLAEVAGAVFYLPLYEETPHTAPAVQLLHETPLAITGEGGHATGLQTKQGYHAADGIFVLRESIAPAQLVPGLTVEDGHVAVDRTMATAVPGCFACGDLVGRPYQYIKAAGEGNIAALSAVGYLDAARRAAAST